MATETRSLSNISIFSGLTPLERDTLAAQCRWFSYRTQEVVIEQEEQNSDVYFVLSGMVRVVTYGANGKEVSFADISEGECFGELSAIDNKPRSAGVVALEPSHVAIMSSKNFMKALETYPVLAVAVLKRVVAILRGASDRITQMSTLGAYNRVYSELLRLAKKAGAKEGTKNIVLSPAPMHLDIATRISATRETVARAFGIMTRRKVVKRVKGGVEILDLPKLQEMVHEYEE
jgi:CRP/FNR family transcriptional regulator, cyclic AMP receptor protein